MQLGSKNCTTHHAPATCACQAAHQGLQLKCAASGMVDDRHAPGRLPGSFHKQQVHAVHGSDDWVQHQQHRVLNEAPQPELR
jgi:hypothetical protein